ncbi:DUF4397 domain-containing protein [Alteribacter natronophilus]|uniref:DUF4397 domain-containing protein n=1 Tax=Alteribacter natronophilus TaxID=2583810 RepID=UPI00110DA6C5|nr:DUF4397 domain-containing protein [Alteribacter natronophilus]TMW73499.1 DUF4397 domain-containing protein [Alteribacter natronophilus]
MKKWILICTLIAITAVCMAAGPVSAAAGDGSDAFVRAVHASPDAPAVDIYLDKERVLENVNFKDISSYLPLKAGSYSLRIFAAGANPKKEDPVIEKNVEVAAGSAYTLAAVGPLNQIDLVAVSDQLEPSEGKAKLRAAHFSPDAPAVDIAAAPDTILFENVSFPQVSDYLEVDGESYNIEIRPTGSQEAVFQVPNVALEEGAVYSAFAVGLLEGEPGFDLILVKDELE